MRKILTIVVICSIVLSLIACSTYGELSIEIPYTAYSVDVGAFTIWLVNETEVDAISNGIYRIERLVEEETEEWKHIHFSIDEQSLALENPIILRSGTRWPFAIHLFFEHTLEAGTYRLVKTFVWNGETVERTSEFELREKKSR